MSSSSPRPFKSTLALLATLATASILPWAGSAHAARSQLQVVAVVPSAADHEVTLVVNVRPPPAEPIPADRFAVATGGLRLPTRAVPVISDRPAIGLVVDSSARGDPGLAAAASGAANFLLQMPLAARIVVVANTTPPTVLAPLRTGAADALRALSAVPVDGTPDTSNALNLVIRQLPPAGDGPRVVILHTSAPDAGGEPATELGERLRNAHVVLGVVTTASDTAYWSQVAAATGGVVNTARPAAPMAAFDDVSDALRTRYVLTFPQPSQLPARVSLRVSTPDGAVTADAVVPAPSGGSAVTEALQQSVGGDRAGGIDPIWPALAIGAVVVAGALLVLQRRFASPASPNQEQTPELPASTDSPGPVVNPVPAAAVAVATQRADAARAAARAMAGREAGEAAAGSSAVVHPGPAAAVAVAKQRARAGRAAARAVAGRAAGEAAAASEARTPTEGRGGSSGAE
jgi:hypothetical protein